MEMHFSVYKSSETCITVSHDIVSNGEWQMDYWTHIFNVVFFLRAPPWSSMDYLLVLFCLTTAVRGAGSLGPIYSMAAASRVRPSSPAETPHPAHLPYLHQQQ
jgi:hypothetical protein